MTRTKFNQEARLRYLARSEEFIDRTPKACGSGGIEHRSRATLISLSCLLSYICQSLHMETTLTVRLPKKQRDALKRRAAAEKRSESAVVRELIEREMDRGFEFERVRHVVGSIVSPRKHWEKNPWRKQIRQRNWPS